MMVSFTETETLTRTPAHSLYPDSRSTALDCLLRSPCSAPAYSPFSHWQPWLGPVYFFLSDQLADRGGTQSWKLGFCESCPLRLTLSYRRQPRRTWTKAVGCVVVVERLDLSWRNTDLTEGGWLNNKLSNTHDLTTPSAGMTDWDRGTFLAECSDTFVEAADWFFFIQFLCFWELSHLNVHWVKQYTSEKERLWHTS